MRHLQQDFCAYLLDRPSAIETEIAGDIGVYHHAYRAQLLACLRDTFEKTWSWLGDDAFEAAALAHIEAHPPQGWSLNFYGDGFDRTLAGLHADDAEIAELAWLEWALRRAFDGPDADAASPAGLADIDWDNAMLHPVPTLAIGRVTTNCAALWSALAENAVPPAAERLAGPAAIRVWRQGLSARFRSIGASEAKALQMARDGADFAQICAALAADLGEEAGIAEIGRLLGLWLQDGVIAAISDQPGDRLPMSA